MKPDNHLDAQLIEWLQDQLERLSGCLVLFNPRPLLPSIGSNPPYRFEVDRASASLRRQLRRALPADIRPMRSREARHAQVKDTCGGAGMAQPGPRARSTKQGKPDPNRIEPMREAPTRQAKPASASSNARPAGSASGIPAGERVDRRPGGGRQSAGFSYDAAPKTGDHRPERFSKSSLLI